MADAVIGALRVILGADTALFEKNLKGAQSALSNFAASATKIAAGIGLEKLVEGLASSITHSIKDAITSIDKLGSAAQKIGIPVEELSALSYAAKLSDVSLDTLSGSLGKLSQTMTTAAAKPTSDAANAFRALGVSATDSSGKLKTSTDVMLDVAAKFAGLKDGAGKTAVSMALFGKAGSDLIPMLNEGRTGIAAYSAEAKELGLVVSGKTAKAVEEYSKDLKRLTAVKNALFLQITEGLLPSLQQLSTRMLTLAKENAGVDWAKTIGSAFLWLTEQAEVLAMSFTRLSSEWTTFKNFMTTLPFTEASKKAWDEHTATIQKNKDAVTLTRLQYEALRTGPFQEQVTQAKKKLEEFNFAALGGKNALDEYIASQWKAVNAVEAEVKTATLSAGAKEKLRIVTEGVRLANEKMIPGVTLMHEGLNKVGTAAEIAALKLGNIKVIGEANPFAELQRQIEGTNAALAIKNIKTEDAAKLSEQAARLETKSWETASASIGGSFESIGSSISGMNDEWKRAAKIGQAIAASVAFINAFVAASEALKTAIFPLNVAIAAGVLAKGLAMVAAIKGAAFASGGSFTVPGGTGGGDSRMVPLSLEPGEQVDVWRPDQLGGDPRGRSGGGTREITIRADGAWRPFVESLIPQLNAAMRDGHELKLAT